MSRLSFTVTPQQRSCHGVSTKVIYRNVLSANTSPRYICPPQQLRNMFSLSLFLNCFHDFRAKAGYPSLPPGGRPSSNVLYPGPPSSSPRPPTPPFSCLSRCNRAISFVVVLSFSPPPPSWWRASSSGPFSSLQRSASPMQLFSHTCSLCWCFSETGNVSRPCNSCRGHTRAQYLSFQFL